jgi:hypothetical protein
LYVNSHPYNVCLAEMTEGQWSLKYWFSFFIHNFLWPLKLQNVTWGAIRNIVTSHIVLILYGLAYIMSLLTPVMLSYMLRRFYNILYFMWLYNDFFIILYNILKNAELRLLLQCINGVSSNPVEGRTKIWQLKNLILTLFGLIFRRIYIYI